MSGHGPPTMEIEGSRWQWHMFKDMFHLYFMFGCAWTGLVIGYCNIFIGPAQLAPIPEGYEPKHWEYYRVSTITLSFLFFHGNLVGCPSGRAEPFETNYISLLYSHGSTILSNSILAHEMNSNLLMVTRSHALASHRFNILFERIMFDVLPYSFSIQSPGLLPDICFQTPRRTMKNISIC